MSKPSLHVLQIDSEPHWKYGFSFTILLCFWLSRKQGIRVVEKLNDADLVLCFLHM